MARIFAALMVFAVMAGVARAEDSSQQDVMREVGAVLGWRLGPESVEETCRAADPQGVEIRKKALDAWLRKNAAIIKSVDARIAEVLPLLYPEAPAEKVNESVRDQVK